MLVVLFPNFSKFPNFTKLFINAPLLPLRTLLSHGRSLQAKRLLSNN